MNKLFTSLNLLCFSITMGFSQGSETQTFLNELNQTIIVGKASHFSISPELSSLPTLEESELEKERENEFQNEFKLNKRVNPNALPKGNDPVWQKEKGQSTMRNPIVSWNGNSGGGPPDPSGAAGPNHYMQAVNTKFSIYDKTGTKLAGPFNLSSLWPNSTNLGDPIVMYDRHADRWFISQLQWTTYGSKITGLLIAISKTSDPTGQYYTYEFKTPDLPDYMKYSIWSDGYYMTSNSANTSVVYERDKMLVGDPSASYILLSATGAKNMGFRSVLPADADGDLPPYGTPCYFFNLEDDGWSGVTQDQIRIYKMETDWVTPSNTKVTMLKTLATEPFDTDFGNSWNNIKQPGTSKKLDAITGIFNYRAQYTRWVGYNSVTLCHVVDVDGTDKGGIRWYELRDADDGNWIIHQQSTYAPNDTDNRFIGSIGMNYLGDIALGFCVSGPDTYPSIRYTGRLASDPLGVMTRQEITAASGNKSQTNSNRYGDYSHLSLDPDGETFWFTGEYLNNGVKTRIFSFNIADAFVGIENIYHKNLSSKFYVNNDILHIDVEGLYKDNVINISIFSINGQKLFDESVESSARAFNFKTNISSLSKGTYIVRYGNKDFKVSEKMIF